VKRPSYPSQAAQVSGFFELGPPLPPPSPLLLSNVPSELILQRRELIDPRERITNVETSQGQQSRINRFSQFTENASSSYPNVNKSSVSLPKNEANTRENFAGNGCTSGYKGGSCSIVPNRFDIQHPSGHAEGRPIEGVQSQIREDAARTRADKVEQCIAEKMRAARTQVPVELMKKIETNREKQEKVLRQIGELFRLIPHLKQKEVDSKIMNDAAAIHKTNAELNQAITLTNQLKNILSFLEANREKYLAQVKKLVPDDVYQQFICDARQQIKQSEVDVENHYKAPEKGVAYMYIKDDFKGDQYEMKPGFYDFPRVGGLGNNGLRSLKIPDGIQVVLFKRAKQQGPVLVYRGPKWVDSLPTGFRNNVSGILIKALSSGPKIDMWDGPFFQGKRAQLIGPGDYDYPQSGIGNKRLASMIIPDGFSVYLYTRPKFTGESIVFKGPQRVAFLPTAWKDKVTGIKIIKN
jgi:hypothetical protein